MRRAEEQKGRNEEAKNWLLDTRRIITKVRKHEKNIN